MSKVSTGVYGLAIYHMCASTVGALCAGVRCRKSVRLGDTDRVSSWKYANLRYERMHAHIHTCIFVAAPIYHCAQTPNEAIAQNYLHIN